MLLPLKELFESTGNGGLLSVRANYSAEVVGAVLAVEELNVPIVLEIRPDPVPILNVPEYTAWVRSCCERASVPIALSMELGGGLEDVQAAIDNGVSSIYIQQGHQQRALTAEELCQVAELAHKSGVSCTAKLGDKENPPTPESAVAFVKATGIDCLAAELVIRNEAGISVDHQRLEAVLNALDEAGCNCPLMLHGCFGLSLEQLHDACEQGIAVVNISKDIWKSVRDQVSADHWDPLAASARAVQSSITELIRAVGAARG